MEHKRHEHEAPKPEAEKATPPAGGAPPADTGEEPPAGTDPRTLTGQPPHVPG